MTSLLSRRLIPIALALVAAPTWAALPLEKLKLAPGYKVSVYSEQVPGARSMALSPEGTLYVGTRETGEDGRVYALPDRNRDGRPDEVRVIASGLEMPNGVAFHAGSLYVAEVSRILRFDRIEERLAKPPEPIVVSKAFPSDRSHGWKFIKVGPDGKLYVPVGAPCNVCERPGQPIYSTIQRMNLDGSGLETFASGVRNSVGFDWHPKTRELWFTDNGRDWLGDDVPPDELNHAPKAGMDFGFPYCHAGRIQDPEFGAKKPCSATTPPAQELGPHVAGLGIRFFKDSILIAEHGSWNRTQPIGYRVMRVRLDGNRAVAYEPFVEGWLQGRKPWGRPVDVQPLPDGSVLVSDDLAGAIYRIQASR